MKRNSDRIPDPRGDAIKPVLDRLQAINTAHANRARASAEDEGITQPSHYHTAVGRFALGLVAKQKLAAAEIVRIDRARTGSRTKDKHKVQWEKNFPKNSLIPRVEAAPFLTQPQGRRRGLP